MNKNCLTCKWEPEWSEWIGKEIRRCFGKCRYPLKSQLYPQSYTVVNRVIERCSDDSGVCGACITWDAKSKKAVLEDEKNGRS